MRRPIPSLEDYGLSPITGFLPSNPPICRLPQKYYRPWENVLDVLNSLLLSGRLKEVIDDLPLLDVIQLRNDAERRRAFVVLSFLAHAYVWGGEQVSDSIPASIAVPWDLVAKALHIRPVCSHASLCLWNWRPIFQNEPPNLSNLATQHTFTGSSDESWFYLVSTAMEARAAPTLPIVLHALAAVRAQSLPDLTYNLRALAIHIDDMAVALTRMHDKCDPHVFYHKIRPYLAGWSNMKDAGLPRGLRYEGCEDHEDGLFRQYAGGSNAQSALIHMLDIALGVDHRDADDAVLTKGDSQGNQNSPRNAFLLDMRNYMPAEHRQFLEDLEASCDIRQFCLQHRKDAVLSEAYDACLAMLKVFRDRHLAIVSRYIVIPAAKSRDSNSMPVKGSNGLAKVKTTHTEQLKGTGGTNLMNFLKQSRDETGRMAVSNWAKTLMANNYGSIDLAQADHRLFTSLTGSFVNEADWQEGGLCL